MTAAHKPGMVFCEMVKMDPLVRLHPQTLRLLDYEEGMHPIGAQLCGSRPELAATSARIVEERGFDVVDLNCGCPVDKVTKDGSGSGLLKTPEKLGEIIANMVAAVKIPVTVKVRAGWDDDQITVRAVTRIAEEAGATMICVHGRTREQGYHGPARWEWIRWAKEEAKNILVFGNGDLFDPPSVEKMFAETGCDGVLLARGTMGRPWLIDDIYHYFSGGTPRVRGRQEILSTLMDHFDHVVGYYGLPKAVLDMRRIGCWYVKEMVGARDLRDSINRAGTIEAVRDLLLAFAKTQ
jgi:nifR3 family TIM-barrel protein